MKYFYQFENYDSYVIITNTKRIINMWSWKIINSIQLRDRVSSPYYMVYINVGRNWKKNDDYELLFKVIKI